MATVSQRYPEKSRIVVDLSLEEATALQEVLYRISGANVSLQAQILVNLSNRLDVVGVVADDDAEIDGQINFRR